MIPLIKNIPFIILFCLCTSICSGQESLQLISSFAKFLEEKSDQSNYPEYYHFDYAYEVEQSEKDINKTFYILSPKEGKYFGMTSQLEKNDLIIFDITLDQMIVFCQLDSNSYAISGPLSFFDSNKNSSQEFNFQKQRDQLYVDKENNLEIVLTQDSKFDNYGLKKGFWMIIQESSTLETPLSEKGVILNVKKLEKKSSSTISYIIKERKEINIKHSIKMSRLLDFSVLAVTTLIKQKINPSYLHSSLTKNTKCLYLFTF